MSRHLSDRPWTSAAMLAVWDDAAVLRHALAFEVALARAQESPEIAAEIERACSGLEIDAASLADEAAYAGTLAIPLVARLREALSPAVADAVHRGATSQDLADTVMVLQARDAAKVLSNDLDRLVAALAALANRYAETPTLGRTLLQDALPISFGLRAAQWLTGIADARRGLEHALDDALLLQFGGPVGARAPLSAVARELGLKGSPAAWHGRRGAIARLGAALAILIGAVGKVARDVSLLAQGAIGEVAEPVAEGRGGSSSMPHKRNQTGCQVALAAAARAPGLASGLLAALPQELERGLGGWQAEAPVLADLFLLAGGAAEAMADVAAGLEVDTTVMARNLARAKVGEDIGESAALARALVAEYGSRG